MKKLILLCVYASLALVSRAQTDLPKAYPTHWFAGMKNSFVQVMLQGSNIGNTAVSLNYPGVKLVKVHKVENVNYLFVDLSISVAAKPGTLQFSIKETGKTYRLPFQLKSRRKGNGSTYALGVTSKDFMYLIMPDRFSNGDFSNDQVPRMKDQSLRRDTVYNRHGGDLKGVENKLDYLKELGVTAIWLNPIIENDMPTRTEHGYAFTNHYKVDPRLGGDDAYLNLVDAAHKKGMKIIQDAVYNHVGVHHHTVVDPPMKDWLHQWPKYTNTTYKDQVLFDPYASKKDVTVMSDGWFTREMPDLNQDNPFVANFLIQHAIWTVEEFGIDGWRIDTYAYNDLDFMNRCNKALVNEFPALTLFGETWVHGVPNQSYFCENNYNIPFKSNLQAVTDFQTLWGITDAMTKDFGWNDGVNKLYTTLAQDFVYKDPMRNVIFLDNHDLSRFYSVIGEHKEKYKSSLSWLLTCRGIPQLYYGAEVNMTGVTSPNDGFVRQDFPGGWPSDTVNKFTLAGRVGIDQQIWNHIAALAKFRKSSSAITTGKMMQFVPEDGVYVYFRYDTKQTVMIAMNTSKEKKEVRITNFAERTNGFTLAKNVISNERNALADFSLEAHQTVVLELIK
ncbi:MAG: alpha-amylase family glycosyl hydrolase [Ferruginibacter sp.]